MTDTRTKKEVRTLEQGLVHIYTGDGKGKTTAALGLAMRAIGHKKKVKLVRFLKGGHSGELTTAEYLQDWFSVEQINPFDKSIFRLTAEEEKKLADLTGEAWIQLMESVKMGEYELYILDEIFGAIKRDHVKIPMVSELIQGRANQVELVLTGRNAPEEICQMADYVTVLQKKSHPFDKKIPARLGIEY